MLWPEGRHGCSIQSEKLKLPWFLPIWLCILNAMSNCRMTSKNWNHGLISTFCIGMWTANTMLLASILFAMVSSKVRIFSHTLGPHGMNHFVSSLYLLASTHFEAKELNEVVGLGADETKKVRVRCHSYEIFKKQYNC